MKVDVLGGPQSSGCDAEFLPLLGMNPSSHTSPTELATG